MAKTHQKSQLLQAVPLNPKTGKQARTVKGKAVIYGYKAPDGSITPLDMKPQKFTKTEVRQLQTLINRNKITAPPDTTFFEKPTTTNEKYKGGETYKIKVTDSKTGKQVVKTKRAKKGEQRWILKDYKKDHKAKIMKVVFQPPKYKIKDGKKINPVYRKIEMRNINGKLKKHTSDWRVQERTTLERLEDQMLASVTELKSAELKDAKGGVKVEDITLRGHTLKETLSTIRPPQSYEQLNKQGVTGIGIDITVKFNDMGTWKSFNIGLGAIGLNEFSDISTILSKTIRSELLDRGKTFTKLKTFKAMRTAEKTKSKKTKDPYYKDWRKTAKVMGAEGIHDMDVELNKSISQYDELNQGDLKVNVSFRYYTGQEQM